MLFVGQNTGNGNIAASMFAEEERTYYSSATLEDSFSDCTVHVVLNRQESLRFRRLSVRDFPEYNFSGVVCITPGIESAQEQAFAINSRNFGRLEQIQGSPHSVQIGEFRRIISLTLSEPSREGVLEAVRRLEKRSDVISASPNFYEYLEPVFNEHDIRHDYHEANFAPMSLTVPSGHWGLTRVRAPEAWAITTGSSAIRVAVLDTGIDASHPDLSSVVNRGLARNFTTENRDVNTDPHGHGTRVAGIISGSVGLARNVSLISLRVAIASGSASINAQVQAIQFATTNRIQIINASLGGTTNDNARLQAIQNFPGLFVTGAGNERNNNDANPRFPANHRNDSTNVMSVAASNSNDAWAAWGFLWQGPASNWGRETVCLFAPGDSIRSTRTGGGHNSENGTSFAAPFVAATAALMLSVNPNLGAHFMRELIILTTNTSVNSNIRNYCISGGRLDAYMPVRAAYLMNSMRGMSMEDMFDVLARDHGFDARARLLEAFSSLTFAHLM